jgi:flagellar hook-associated protein 2
MSTPSITSSTGPLDVQGLVSQLMTVADQPLNQMNSQLQSYQTKISNYGTLNSDLTSLQSSLTPLASGQFVNTFKATSSNANVLSATASTQASAGNYSVSVTNLATPQNVAFDGQSSETNSLGNSAETLNFTFGNGTTSTVNIAANSSLDNISAAINAAGIGVSASVVTADNSSTPYRLVLTGSSVGSGQAFSTSISGSATTDATGQVVQDPLSFLNFDASSAVNSSGTITDSRLTEQAQNANLTVNGLSMTSTSNAVTNAINGVTLNLTEAGSTTLTVASDATGIQSQVQSFVSAYNQMVNDTNNLYQGSLQGDFTLVTMQNMFSSLLNTPISGASGSDQVAYLAQVGVSLQKDGTLSLDDSALNTAIANNPSAVAKVFGNSNNDGFAQRFNTTINSLLGPQGLITSSTTTLNTDVKDENNRISQEQERLSTLQNSYLTQYSSLNSALAQMEQTSSSLSSMIAAA